MIVLGYSVPVREVRFGCIRACAVMIPATTLLTDADLANRMSRDGVRAGAISTADASRYAAHESLIARRHR